VARSDSTANFVIEIDNEDSAKPKCQLNPSSNEEDKSNKEEAKLWMHNCEQVVSTMESKQKKETGKTTTIKDFESLKVLGTGTYGKVMLVRHKISRKLYAMKVLKISVIKEKNQVEHTKTERRVLEKLVHPFVVRMKYAFKDR
jgi:hypothetical protein